MATSTDAESLDQLPPLFERDRKMFGIGQGNFRVTPLQVANAFATLARRGRCQAAPPVPEPAVASGGRAGRSAHLARDSGRRL